MNKDETAWMDLIHELPCLLEHTGDCGGRIEADHITSGGRRLGHIYSLPLCTHHHTWNSPLPIGQAFHKGPKAWERNHGKQIDLWVQLREKMGFDAPLPKSKIVPRRN